MRVLDLFSGIGGISLGLERAGMKTVAFVENDELCQKVLKKNRPDVPIYGDIRRLTNYGLGGGMFYEEAGDSWPTPVNSKYHSGSLIDLVCGGYPCTGHSVAGKKDGFKDEGSALWEEYHRVVKEIRPKFCLLENSPNLRNTGLEKLLKAFSEIGYNAEWQVTSGYSVGSPHQRERFYCVFWREDVPYSDPFRLWRATTEAKEKSEWWSERPFSFRGLFEQIRGIKPSVRRGTDGVSFRLDFPRRDRIKQLGNAAMPQISELIGKQLMEVV